MIFCLLALLFDLNYQVKEIARNFPQIEQMSVLEVGEGKLHSQLPSTGPYGLNDFSSNRAYELILSDSLDKLSFVHLPNGCVALNQASPVDAILLLKQHHKKGKIFSVGSKQLVLWRDRIDNGLTTELTRKDSRIFIEYSAGRLGDQLVAYLHGKWASMKSGIPIRFTPFYDCRFFALHTLESREGPPFKTKPRRLATLKDFLHIPKITYGISYFPESEDEFEMYPYTYGSQFYLDWQDPLFKQEMKKMLAPTFTPKTLHLPPDRKSIAIHIRTGGTYENFNECHKNYPLKFPQFQFYLDALKTLLPMYPGEKFYIYLFTDDAKPRQLLDTLASHFPHHDILWDTNTKPPIEDFYFISSFDCLIRGASHFSLVAGFYGDPEVTLAATHSRPPLRHDIDEITLYYDFSRQ